MPIVSENHKNVLGPLIEPFERSPKKTIEDDIRKGEGHNDEFLDKIHDGRNNSFPEPLHIITVEELKKYRIEVGGKFVEKCYLWVIDETSIKIIYELTRNVRREEELPEKGYVCHTNITGCKPAYIGGEIFFCEDGKAYVNFASDRYGRPETEEKKLMAIQYMRDCGYDAVMTEFYG